MNEMEKSNRMTAKRILVVDDDEGLRKLISKVLTKKEYEIVEACNGEQAIQTVRGSGLFLMLLDHNLPDMTGKEVVNVLRKEQIDIPFIMMTGQGDERLAVELMKMGAVDYLVKDVDLIELLPEVLDRVFRNMETENLLKDTENNLRRQLEEKEILLRETHHRIKNNIASIIGMLNLQISKTANTEAVSSLKEAVGRIKSMLKLYDKMMISGEYQDIDAGSYLKELVDSVIGIYNNAVDIQIEKQIESFQLNSKILFSLGIIINEILTNAMKYAFQGKESGLVVVQISREDKTVSVQIKDNGAGLPDGFSIENSQGFGLTLVNILCKQLGASLTIKSGNGTFFQFSFHIE